MTLITDIVDLADLTAEAREIDDPATYTLSQFLPVREIDDVEYKLKHATIQRGVAQYRAWDAPTPIGRRSASVTEQKQRLLPFGQKLVIGEYETILLNRARGATDESLVRSIYDDNRSNVAAIRARMEIGRGQVLSTGKFALTDENGLTDVVNYFVPDTNLNVNLGVLLSDPTADLFGILETLDDAYAAANDESQRPGARLTSRRVVNAMRRNIQVIKSQYGQLATTGRVSVSQLNDIMASEGFPPIFTNDVTIQGKRLIPDHLIINTPSDPSDMGSSVYGITAEALELTNSRAVDFTLSDAPGITSTVMKEDDAVKIWTKGAAVGFPALDRGELLQTAVALAPAA